MDTNDTMDTFLQTEQQDSAILKDILQILENNGTGTFEALPMTETHSVASPQSLSSSASSSPTFTGHAMQTTQPNIVEGEPYIKIVEQPHPKGLRFRYICEGRSAGSIPGINSTPENKTFPTIEIVGYNGNVKIIVSCVTVDEPYRPHPHNLVGKDGCEYGVCTMRLKGAPMRAVFSNLGIQCVKKKDIRAALEERERINIDPFKTKFTHKDQPSTIDLNVVRLCFQAFIPLGPRKYHKLKPVVSEPIFDKKSINDLVITRLCSCSAKVTGGDSIILLCEKLPKDDIKIRFYEERDNQIIWEDFGEFQAPDIHKQHAIAFKTPRYHNTEIEKKAQVYIQLVRYSNEPGANQQTISQASDPLPFEFYPEPDHFKRKRQRYGGNPMRIVQQIEQMQNSNNNSNPMWIIPPPVTSPAMPEIKNEPFLSPNYGTYRSPYQMSPSPQPPSPMNRNSTTPSPGLMKCSSAENQTQMCNDFNQFDIDSIINPSVKSPNGNPSNLTYLGNRYDNSHTPIQMQTSVSTSNLNPFCNLTSGGSITPLYTNENNANVSNTSQFHAFNIGDHNPNISTAKPTANTGAMGGTSFLNNVDNQFSYQFQQYQHNQTQPQLQQSEDTTEGAVTLSALLQIESDKFVNINSEELKLSNLSIST